VDVTARVVRGATELREMFNKIRPILYPEQPG
jgi:hypothetical protein